MDAIDLLKKAILLYENSPQSLIDKDILLEQIRQSYRLLLQGDSQTEIRPAAQNETAETTASASMAVADEEITDNEVILEEDYFELEDEVVEEKTVVAVEEKVNPVVEEVITPSVEIHTTTEPEKAEKPVASVVAPVAEPIIEEPKVEEMPPAEKTISSLNENFSTNANTSFNEKLQSNSGEMGLNERFAVGSMKSLIDFNRKFVFIQELFKGDSEAYHLAIDTIDKCDNIQSAFHFITSSVLPTYKWDMNLPSVKLFDKLVRQKFGKL